MLPGPVPPRFALQDQTAQTRKQKPVLFDLANSKDFEDSTPPEIVKSGPKL
jgi:hypothetical protein